MAVQARTHDGMRRGARWSLLCLFIALLSLLQAGCEGCLKRAPVEAVDRLPYPSCGEGPLPEGEVIDHGHLRSGPESRDHHVVEYYEVRRRACLYSITVRQEWPLGTAEVEVLYDDAWLPLRVWKRMTMPTRHGHIEDIRLYDLRTTPVSMTRSSEDGIEHFHLRGARPVAVIGPGRALVSAWIRANDLEVGETTRGPVLDFREMLERIDTIALRRDPARSVPSLGGDVRVYTVFGRESLFFDEEFHLLGDLGGLRPDAILETPPPEPQPRFGAPDPIGTP